MLVAIALDAGVRQLGCLLPDVKHADGGKLRHSPAEAWNGIQGDHAAMYHRDSSESLRKPSDQELLDHTFAILSCSAC